MFVLGHSLGGLPAPRIAAADPAIAGLILMAAAVKPLEQSILEQTCYLVMLDGKVSAEEEAALAAMTRLAADVRALKPGDPPIVSTGTSAPASYWLDPARIRPARGGQPHGAADARAAR